MSTRQQQGAGGPSKTVKYVACPDKECKGASNTKRLEGPLLYTSHHCLHCGKIIYKPEDKNN